MCGAIVSGPIDPKSSIEPSPGPCDVIWCAMLPPAPGLFSTTTDCPMFSESFLAISRAEASAAPQGGKHRRQEFAADEGAEDAHQHGLDHWDEPPRGELAREEAEQCAHCAPDIRTHGTSFAMGQPWRPMVTGISGPCGLYLAK